MELQEEQKAFWKSAKDLQTCRARPTPTFLEDEPEFSFDPEALDTESTIDSDALDPGSKMIRNKLYPIEGHSSLPNSPESSIDSSASSWLQQLHTTHRAMVR